MKYGIARQVAVPNSSVIGNGKDSMGKVDGSSAFAICN
jgi:hypothetical protein